jgi:GMP synthase-like glutamine amidotransferase
MELPTLEAVQEAALVILGGGRSSANGTEEWIRKLREEVIKWVDSGACFVGSSCVGYFFVLSVHS